MAVQSTRVNTTLSLKYKTGIDGSGNDILKTKRFSNVKVIAAPDQNIFDTAAALSSLLKYEVTDVVRNDDNLIINA